MSIILLRLAVWFALLLAACFFISVSAWAVQRIALFAWLLIKPHGDELLTALMALAVSGVIVAILRRD